ncbi:hypothetical protein J4436_01295 [Candidatus Woesearchaeota archaeon]|nr:hypothetical protein [Candidatus Woesearchaeota archaeon]
MVNIEDDGIPIYVEDIDPDFHTDINSVWMAIEEQNNDLDNFSTEIDHLLLSFHEIDNTYSNETIKNLPSDLSLLLIELGRILHSGTSARLIYKVRDSYDGINSFLVGLEKYQNIKGYEPINGNKLF